MHFARNAAIVLMVLAAFSAISAAAIIATPNDGNSFLLSQVNASGGIKVGDLQFSSFTINNNKLGYGFAGTLDTVSVQAVEINGEKGLYFQGNWAAANGGTVNSVIRFALESSGGDISGNTFLLYEYGTVNEGLVTATENVYATDPLHPSPALSVENVFYRSDDDNLAMQQKLFKQNGLPVTLDKVYVTKSIQAHSVAQGSSAALTGFFQTFSQVPEPATMGLLVLGGLHLLARRRR